MSIICCFISLCFVNNFLLFIIFILLGLTLLSKSFFLIIISVFFIELSSFLSFLFWYIPDVILVLIPIVLALIAVAFYTLLERKILGYIQNRKGPNKVRIIGILQPFRDAGKLFTKEYVIPTYSTKLIFLFCPLLILVSSLLLWTLYPCSYLNRLFICGLLQFLAISSFSVYGVMLAGWRSNSKYALLGSVRAIAQSISYEIPLSFTIILVMFRMKSLWIENLLLFQKFFFRFILLRLMRILIWIICILAETNRAPFDFVEGESELVSGFNVEYRRGGFAIIFIAEYRAILFNSLFSGVIYVGGGYMWCFFIVFIVFTFLWARGTLPRIRYDKIMKICWGRLLISSIIILTLVVVWVIILNI